MLARASTPHTRGLPFLVSPRTLGRVRIRCLAALLGSLSLFVLAPACSSRPRPPGLIDAQVDALPPFTDSDGDGLCDENEATRGTRADLADSDDDGYTDLVEVLNGFDPLLPASPDRDVLVFMNEAIGGTATATTTVSVRGDGESYLGTFDDVPPPLTDGQSAGTFFAGSRAVGATPMENVIVVEGEQFVAVRGRTLLVFETLFEFDGEVRNCMRAYPFQYIVKRDDGSTVAQRRFVLVVTPPGMRPGEGEWCMPAGCF